LIFFSSEKRRTDGSEASKYIYWEKEKTFCSNNNMAGRKLQCSLRGHEKNRIISGVLTRDPHRATEYYGMVLLLFALRISPGNQRYLTGSARPRKYGARLLDLFVFRRRGGFKYITFRSDGRARPERVFRRLQGYLSSNDALYKLNKYTLTPHYCPRWIKMSKHISALLALTFYGIKQQEVGKVHAPQQ
jgi:hypothetical protein